MNVNAPSILWLGESECHQREFVGGKAANLSRLAARYPVPDGFCLTASAFRARERASQRDDLLDEITDAYQNLATRCNMPDPSVAVRSSAIDEDGSTASFAGQYESYLNIVGIEAVFQAVKRCWDSATSERIHAYRGQQGLDHGIPLAVLVQLLIPADVSAVVFSANPITKNEREMVINASWGLGESIVSGTVTPDTTILKKRSRLKISSTLIADKQHMTVRSEGGTREVRVPGMLRIQPALNEEQILEMGQLAQNLEEDMGWPVDIECAYHGEQLYLLQCRPITALGKS
jgi:pyruvate,water dikinase